jgi:DNA invertase Pin-like site-specific DNA recombinase
MLIGYVRKSTADQKAVLEAQVGDLWAVGCQKLFVEQVSSVAKRPHLRLRWISSVNCRDTAVLESVDQFL